jgi:hypothetical protein
MTTFDGFSLSYSPAAHVRCGREEIGSHPRYASDLARL